MLYDITQISEEQQDVQVDLSPNSPDVDNHSAEVGSQTITNTPAEIFAGTQAKDKRSLMKIKVVDSDIRIRIGTDTADLERYGNPLEAGHSYIIRFDPVRNVPLYAVSEGAHVEVSILEF